MGRSPWRRWALLRGAAGGSGGRRSSRRRRRAPEEGRVEAKLRPRGGADGRGGRRGPSPFAPATARPGTRPARGAPAKGGGGVGGGGEWGPWAGPGARRWPNVLGPAAAPPPAGATPPAAAGASRPPLRRRPPLGPSGPRRRGTPGAVGRGRRGVTRPQPLSLAEGCTACPSPGRSSSLVRSARPRPPSPAPRGRSPPRRPVLTPQAAGFSRKSPPLLGTLLPRVVGGGGSAPRGSGVHPNPTAHSP